MSINRLRPPLFFGHVRCPGRPPLPVPSVPVEWSWDRTPRVRDVLDATMPQLGRFNGGITPSIVLSQRVEQPLHHPFDARCIRVHKALLDADPKARCLLSYRKKTGKLYRDCS